MVKPIFSAFQAWSCLVISLFAMVILSILGSLFSRNHQMVMGLEEDPEDHAAVAKNLYIAVSVYACFFFFCGGQAWLHKRQSKRGAISLR